MLADQVSSNMGGWWWWRKVGKMVISRFQRERHREALSQVMGHPGVETG